MSREYYKEGKFETEKFSYRKEDYYKGLEKIKELNYSIDDIIHQFPAFVGHMTLSRFLALYEVYKMVLGVSGHIAEIGVYKGAGSLLFSKLVKIFEPESFTLVHGFDWFRGMEVGDDEKNIIKGSYKEPYEKLISLIKAQNLQNILKIHNIDLIKETDKFFKENNYMQFKLLFFDAGIYDVVKNSLEYFWERLTPGGVLVLDQYNFELAPGETRAVKEILPNEKIKTFPWAWMPTAYIVKE